MKNEFDDIIKKKWEKFHFPVDPQHRSDMNALLDQTHRRKGGIAWWLGAVALLIMLGAGIFYLNDGNNSFTENLSADQPAGGVDKSEVSGNVLNVDNRNIDTTSSIKSLQQNTETDEPEFTDQSESSIINENSINSTVTSFTPVSNYDTNKNQKSKPVLNNAIGNGLKSKTKNANTKPAGINKQANVPMANAAHEVETIENTAPLEPGTEKNSNISSDISHSGKDVDNIILSEPMQENIGDAIQPRQNYMLPNLDDVEISEVEYSADYDIPTIIPAATSKRSIHLFAETGAGYVPSTSAGIKAGWSFKAGGGLGYGLFDKTDLIFSAGYMFQKDGFAFERSSTSNTPGFGARSNFHYLAPDKLHFVYSKIGIQHRIRRHILSATAGAQWLYGAQGKIVIQITDQFTGVSEQPSYGWLVLKGMQRLIWTGELNYGYQVSSRLSMHLGLKYNFSSLRVEDEELKKEGFQWSGKFAPFQPAFTINYRFYGKK